MKVRFNAPPATGTELNGLTVKYAAAKRQLPRLRWYLLLLLVTAPLIYLVARIVMGVLWDSSPGFVSMPQVILRTPISGRVELLVHEGDSVSAGALVARTHPVTSSELTSPPIEGRPALAQFEVERASNRLAQSQAVKQLTEEQYARMGQRLAAVNRLISEGAATAAERAQAEAQLTAAKSDMLRAHAEVEDARGSLRSLKLSQSLKTEDEARRRELPIDVAASAAGTVVHFLVNNQNWVAAGSDVVLIQLQAEPEIRVFISPSDEKNARVGVHADLRFLDGQKIGATVIKIEAETARLPPERVGPLATRIQSIVAVLKPDQPLPARYRISDLPLDVRFNQTLF